MTLKKIRQLYLRFLKTDRVAMRYLVVGGLNTVFGFSFFPLFYWLLHAVLNVNLLVTLSHLCCAVFAFVTHKYFTFHSSGKIQHEGGKFLIVQLINWAINLGLLNLAMVFISLSAFTLQMLISLLMTLGNYFIYKHLIFLNPRSPTP